MATVVIRPDEIGSSTGFDASGATLLGLINDNDTGTGATQNNVSADIQEISFENTGYSGTINSVVVSIVASTSARSAQTVLNVKLIDSGGTTLNTDSHVISSGDGTIQKDGSSYTTSLTPSVVDGLVVDVEPDTSGCVLYEVFITVDFTAAAVTSGGKITLSSGKITLTSGKITL